MTRFMRGMSSGGQVYARGNEPITVEELQAKVPAIFAESAHESRSDRFAPIPTGGVLAGLESEGFRPFFAQQSRTRDASRRDFTKHMIRFRHDTMRTGDGEAFEIILVNANDGTAAYHMIPGFFRFVCANGLFVGETFDSVKVRHTGNVRDAVIEGAFSVLKTAPAAIAARDEMRGMTIGTGESLAFARAAHMLRFESHYQDGNNGETAPVKPERLLESRRYADSSTDLWSVFNRVQENTIRGGQRGLTRDANNRVRRATVREVAGIDQTRGLNRALWTLAEEMAKLSKAA